MSKNEIKTNDLIREYLLEEGLLREKLPDPNSQLEFGFMFSYPLGKKAQRMNVLKPKEKSFIVIIHRTKISENHLKALKVSKGGNIVDYFQSLRKFFIFKEVFFQIDIKNYIFEISDRIFINKEGLISKNQFFNVIKKLHFILVYSNLILEEFCSKDSNQLKKNKSEFNLSFYS